MIRIHDIVFGPLRTPEKFILRAKDKLSLDNLDYELDPKPHAARVKQTRFGEYQMILTKEEVEKALFAYSCR